MKLRAVLGQLVSLTLLANCHHTRTGGGCTQESKSEHLVDVDEKYRELLATCTTEQTCEPVCREVLDRASVTGKIINQCKVVKKSETEADVTFFFGSSCAGRRPQDFANAASGPATVDTWLAEQGRLEAASVIAFVELAGELAAHGAPERLVRACRRAARDEARHARACHGSAAVARPQRAPRSIEELATDNAIEGQVRETWGAVTAAWQARVAGDTEIRALMRGIAPDELRHAELSGELATWYASRLSDAANARVAAAKRCAIEELDRAVTSPVPAELVECAGLPSAVASAQLLAGLRATVWA
ncbi:MAG: ferritin-like domain-containing protein [Kofleriaceae bacterium]